MAPSQGRTFQDFITDRAKTLSQAGSVISSHPQKTCNGKIDGWFMDYKVSLGDRPAEVEQTIAADANTFYMATYSRPANQSENSDARKALDTLCVAAPAQPAAPVTTPSPNASPLPFKPPNGWVNVLSAMPMPAFHGLWTGPKSGGVTSNVAITSTEFAGTVERLSNQTLLGSGMLQSKVTAQHSGTICNLPARFITFSKPMGMDSLVMDQSMYVANGTAYTINYTRGATQPPDPQIQQLLGSLCPDQINSGKIAFPTGWSANQNQGLRSAGMWANPSSPGQMVGLIIMPYAGALSKLSGIGVKDAIPGGTTSKILTVLSRKNGTLCGSPAFFVSMKMNLGYMPMRIDQEATIYQGKAYLLTYARMNSRTPDSAALTSLKTLCPKFLSP